MKPPPPFPPVEDVRHYSRMLRYALQNFADEVETLAKRDAGIFELLELWHKERRAKNHREEIETIRELMRSVLDYALTPETKW